MIAFAITAAAQGAEEHRELPMPTWAYGVLALAVFFGLFALTWAFRSVGHRH
jgi:protein-S-isoprenylcysteine O-methyltransferase Ste14